MISSTLNVRVGSDSDHQAAHLARPESGVKQPKSVTTSAFGGKLPVAEGALGQLLLAITRHSRHYSTA